MESMWSSCGVHVEWTWTFHEQFHFGRVQCQESISGVASVLEYSLDIRWTPDGLQMDSR